MVTLSEQVLVRAGLEDRAEALVQAHETLDDRVAGEIAGGLRVIAQRLTAPPLAALRAATLALQTQVQALGARAMTEAELPPRSGETQQLAALDAGALRLALPDDRFAAHLAGSLVFLARSAEDYVGEALLPALLGTAELACDLREHDAERHALRDLEEVVAQTPRSRRITPRVYTVMRGQELPDIAAGVYGDPQRWPDLIRDYRLYPPYLGEAGDAPREGVLVPGQRLLLPPTDEDREAEGLGYTFALDVTPLPQGGQAWDLIASDGVGLASDRGLAAFATDLALRLATPLGSLDGEPDYGVMPVAGVDASVAGVYQQVVATEALREDPRVARVLISPKGSSALTGVFVGGVLAVPRPELLES